MAASDHASDTSDKPLALSGASTDGKRIKERKRHLVVDGQDLVLQVHVHPANVHDRRAAEVVLADLGGTYPDVSRLFGDMACQGLGRWLGDVRSVSVKRLAAAAGD